VRKDGSTDGEDDRHGTDHESGVSDGGHGETLKLKEELEWNSNKGDEEKGDPLATAKVYPLYSEEWQKSDDGKEEAIKDHVANAHLAEGDLAEEEACAP